MRVRKLYDAEAELLKLETAYLDDEGTFDDNWIVSAGDLFGGMDSPSPDDTPARPLIRPLGFTQNPLRAA
jgi:hypothetical protein